MYRISIAGSVMDVPEGVTVEDAMRTSGHIPDSFVYLVGGRPVPMDSVPPD